jgi:phosphatidylglycerophosphate synthase
MYSKLKRIKFFLDKLARPLMLFLHNIGVRPIHLTFLSFISGVIGSFFMFTNWLYAIVFLTLWFLLDVVDGMLARTAKTEGEFGAKIDFLVDRVVLVLILCRYYEFRQDSKLAVVSGLLAVLILTLGELLRKKD